MPIHKKPNIELNDSQYVKRVNSVVDALSNFCRKNNVRIASEDYLAIKDRESGEILLSMSLNISTNNEKYKKGRNSFRHPLHDYYKRYI